MCGVACGAALKTFGIKKFKMLEKGPEIASFWKNETYDSLALHNPHQDLPYDHGLTFNYHKYKPKLELVEYLNDYSDKYDIREYMKFNSNVVNISKQDDIWILKTDKNDLYYCKYLCMCTSAYRIPKIPKLLNDTINTWPEGTIIHSKQYKNGKIYKNKNVLIIGNGNSAFEIATDLYNCGANKINIVSRRARHVILFNDLDKKIFGKLNNFLKYFGFYDILFGKIFKLTYKIIGDKIWEPDPNFPMDDYSLDLSEYGIKKPKKSINEEMHLGNLLVIDWNNGTVPLIKEKKVGIIQEG